MERFLLTVALALVFALFAYQYFAQGGREYLSPDGHNYLPSARGESVIHPISSRVLGPTMARFISSTTGLSEQRAFHIITITSLLCSLVILINILGRGGASIAYRLVVI